MRRTFTPTLPAVLWFVILAPFLSAARAPADQDAWTRDDAAHLLRRAGFGGTPDQIDRLYTLGKTAAVDYLIDGKAPAGVTIFDPVKLEDFIPAAPSAMRPKKELVEKLRTEIKNAKTDEEKEKLKKQINQQQNVARREETVRVTAWWVDRMVHTDRPLEEKMTLFWHGLFTSGIREVKNPVLLQQQNVLFHKQALGNYRELTHAIVHDPAMLRYLNADQNIKGKPNENLGRELMELFTMGEGQGYTENDIKEVARALTGLAVGKGDDGAAFRPRMHDDGEKTIFGKKGNFGPDEVVELIFSRPQPAQHLSERLWQYFGMPDPAKADVDRVAAVLKVNNFEVKPALKAIFMSDGFYSEKAKFSLIKSPMEMMIETARSLGTPVGQPQALAIANNARQMGQALFQPPNVRGWPGGEHWITSATLFMRYNTVCNAVDGSFAPPQGKNDKGDKIARLMRQRRKAELAKADDAAAKPGNTASEEVMTKDDHALTTPAPVAAETPKLPPNALGTLFPKFKDGSTAGELVDAAVDRFLQRALHPVKRDALVKVLGDAPLKFGDRKDEQKVRDMLGLLMSTPEYQVH